MTARAAHHLTARLGAGLVVLVLLVLCAVPFATPATAAAAKSALSVTLVKTTPRIPDAGKFSQKITFAITLTNTSSSAITGVGVQLQRMAPIVREDYLQKAVAGTDLTPSWSTPQIPKAVTKRLAPHTSISTTLTTNPSSSSDGLCLCDIGIYPIDVEGSAYASDGSTVQASTRTFVPSFPPDKATPTPLQVSWVWPLLDRPHRLLTTNVFTDDDLATSVSAGGRLDRALQTIEDLPSTIRVTLVIDPELIDALYTMTQGYTVLTGKTRQPGTGGEAAAGWLSRLSAVTTRADVSLTAYGDPDIDALAAANLPWSPALQPEVAQNVDAIIGSHDSSVVWPVNQRLTGQGLEAAVTNGASLVLLQDTDMTRSTSTRLNTPNALSPLSSVGGKTHALITDAALEKSVSAALTPANTVNDNQPLTTLLAQLAVRAAGGPDREHYVVLTPPRCVNTDPQEAAQVIETTSHQTWAKSLTVAQAEKAVQPVDRGSLKQGSTVPAATATQMKSVAGVISGLNTFQACFTSADAATLLGTYPAAIARAESGAWRSDTKAGQTYAARLAAAIDRLRRSIRLVQPEDAHYTLASNDAPLYVTVENSLPRPVKIKILVTPAFGVQGFRADPTAAVIPAASGGIPNKHSVKVQAHVERSGRFQITVALQTPKSSPLGQPVSLRVRSNALGTVALWITGAALGVLVLAIIIRLIRRLQRRNRPKPQPTTTPAT